MIGRRRVEHRLQFRVDWNVDNHTGLLLAEDQATAFDVLTAHQHHVGAPLRGVEQ